LQAREWGAIGVSPLRPAAWRLLRKDCHEDTRSRPAGGHEYTRRGLGNGGHPFASGGASGPWQPNGPPPAKPSAQARMEGEALDDLEPGTPGFLRVPSC